MNHALVFAGGVGRRMNTNGTPKQFLKVFGKPIIIYTLEHFQKHDKIDKIFVVCVEQYIEYLKKILEEYRISKVDSIVKGGNTGQQSIYNGLCEIEKSNKEEDIVLIHDGVRPVITNSLISENIKIAKKHGNSISISTVTETIIKKNKENSIENIYKRDECAIAKAPQTFHLKDIIATHRRAIADKYDNAVDSATLMHHYGYKLYYTMTTTSNIKITTPVDYYLFKGMIEAHESMQIIGL